eukprot:gene5666-7052_t
MIDMVFAVEDTVKWHTENLKLNFKDYSFIGYGGPKIVSHIQRTGAKIYYNTLLEYNGIKYKYGVIDYKDLIDDLKNWKSLYVSGRMQKPVLELPNGSDIASKEIKEINCKFNLNHAVGSAILMLPSNFTEYDLYHKICSISYLGDIRMKGGENPNKIHNLIVNNFESFRKIYLPIIDDQFYGKVSIDRSDEKQYLFQSSKLSSDIFDISLRLPFELRSQLIGTLRQNMRTPQDEPKLIEVISNDVENEIRKIVSSSSTFQSFKGIITAGLVKSIRYVAQKLNSSKKK